MSVYVNILMNPAIAVNARPGGKFLRWFICCTGKTKLNWEFWICANKCKHSHQRNTTGSSQLRTFWELTQFSSVLSQWF